MEMKCDITKCKASCCYNVPHTKFTLNTNKKQIVTPYIRLVEQGEDLDGRKLYIPVTDNDFHKNKCPFLTSNFRCSIYDKRPTVCRLFGTPSRNQSTFLHCGWQEGKEHDNPIENKQDENAFLTEMMMSLLNGDKII